MTDEIGEVLFEFIRVGPIMKVVAVHVATGREAIIQAPASLSKQTLQNNALAKLRYLLERDKKGGAR